MMKVIELMIVQAINLKESHEKIIFDGIYTGDADKCQAVLAKIIGIWDLANGWKKVELCNSTF